VCVCVCVCVRVLPRRAVERFKNAALPISICLSIYLIIYIHTNLAIYLSIDVQISIPISISMHVCLYQDVCFTLSRYNAACWNIRASTEAGSLELSITIYTSIHISMLCICLSVSVSPHRVAMECGVLEHAREHRCRVARAIHRFPCLYPYTCMSIHISFSLGSMRYLVAIKGGVLEHACLSRNLSIYQSVHLSMHRYLSIYTHIHLLCMSVYISLSLGSMRHLVAMKGGVLEHSCEHRGRVG